MQGTASGPFKDPSKTGKSWRVDYRDDEGLKSYYFASEAEALQALEGFNEFTRVALEDNPDMTASDYNRVLMGVVIAVKQAIVEGRVHLLQGARTIAQLCSAAKKFVDTSEIEQDVAELQKKAELRHQKRKHHVRPLKRKAFGAPIKENVAKPDVH